MDNWIKLTKDNHPKLRDMCWVYDGDLIRIDEWCAYYKENEHYMEGFYYSDIIYYIIIERPESPNE